MDQRRSEAQSPELAVKEFACDMAANHRRVVTNRQRLDLAVAAAQQFDRARIKQHWHGSRLPDGCWGDASG